MDASGHPKRTYIYVRQSTLAQTVRNTESLLRQYDLAGRARELGWAEHQIVVVDDDLGRSGASAQGRKGFSDLVAEVGLGKAGIVLSLEASRLARNNSDWYQLLDLCALTDTLIADADGVYHPGSYNDRLVLGLKGTLSEALCRCPHKASYADLAVIPTLAELPPRRSRMRRCGRHNLQPVKEGEELVRGPVTSGGDVLGSGPCQRPFLEREVGVDVDLRGRHVLVAFSGVGVVSMASDLRLCVAHRCARQRFSFRG